MVTATVKLWDRPVGVVAWDEARALASFEYYPEFIASGWDIAPLTMPLREAGNGTVFRFARLNTETYHGLPGLLADSLPDRYGTAVIDAWLAGMGRSADSLNPVERLCYIGKRGMGALEFEPALKPTDDRASTIEIAGLVDLAKEILSERTDFKTRLQPGTDEGLEDIIKVGTSAGGARPKAIIAYNEQTNEVRSGQVAAPEGFSHWLLKFDGIGSDITAASQGYGRIEYAYYRMALDCGITMQECRLYEENGRAHFMTRRFDREGSNGKWHTQTLCAMKHYDFKQPALYAYEQAFQVMRELRLPYSAAEEYYRRMVFNVMARNCDDHTKNTSFLMDRDGQWSLAPAYDMSHAFNPGSFWLNAHNMTINGKKSNMNTADLLQVAREMNIKKPAEIIRRVSEVVGNWKQYASDCGVRKKERDELAGTHLLLQA